MRESVTRVKNSRARKMRIAENKAHHYTPVALGGVALDKAKKLAKKSPNVEPKVHSPDSRRSTAGALIGFAPFLAKVVFFFLLLSDTIQAKFQKEEHALSGANGADSTW